MNNRGFFSRRDVVRLSCTAAGLSCVGGRLMLNRAEASGFDGVAAAIQQSVQSGQMKAAVMMVQHRDAQAVWPFGEAVSADSVFLLASITKPMVATSVMALCDSGDLRLDDRVDAFIPEFSGDNRNQVTIRHLLSHCSGLPDQLPENRQLRSSHASLDEFVEGAMRVPLAFLPGSKFLYSSMGILLASEIAVRVSGMPMKRLIQERVFAPLGMQTASLGTGGRPIASLVRCQTEHAAAEAGAGDADSSAWDWNSLYWRELGAPWGGAHGSAGDVVKFLADFLQLSGKVLKPATAGEMVTRQFSPAVTSRGLGFGLGRSNSSRHCSQEVFGHTGSTGTLAWADPKSQAICVVLTTLPGGVVDPHPRQVASDAFATRIRQR
ncbi:MAG TPA: serine hydrolase [Planctomycetaceae bacterium]|nr:serine hydrolase [Planctomycetaceae bacterium]